jgi:hypothetical protein
MSKDKGFSRIALKVPVKVPITEEPAAVRLVSCYRGLMPKLRKNTYAMRYVAGQPAERILPPGSFASVGQAFPAGVPLSTDEKIRVLVWNIFKQQRAEWKSVLKNFGKDAHLVLLQEAQTTPEMVDLRRRTTWPPIRFRLWCCRSTLWRHDAGFGASGVLLPAARA